MTQIHTSKNTFVNKTKVPAVYKKCELNGRVLDYGCGEITTHMENYAKENGANEWFGYDLYNKSEEENKITLNEMQKGFDIGICSNVLNVIDDDNTMINVIKNVTSCCGVTFFYIHEGNKNGIGRETKKDCWQRNERTSNYENLMRNLGYDVKRKDKMLIVKKAA